MKAAPAARLPLWPKLAWSAYMAVLVPVYWRRYGPQNFLWFSDLALFEALASLWRETALPASTAAVAVLPLEGAWAADFLSGGRLAGLAGYMFDTTLPRWLRALSLFHLALPPTLVWLLRRLGYDRRALLAQTALATAVLPLAYTFGTPEANVDWVYGPGTEPQRVLPPKLYLGLLMLGLPALVYLPTHLLLRRLFPPALRRAAPPG